MTRLTASTIVLPLLKAGCTTAPEPSSQSEVRAREWKRGTMTYTDTNGDGQPDKWEVRGVVYLDRNHDGMIDHEEDVSADDYSVSKIDNDYDGYYDWRQTVGFAGSPVLHPIREKVPRVGSP